MVDLVGPHERIIDSSHQIGNAVYGIKALIGISMAYAVVIGGNLPSAYIYGFQASLDLLYGLRAGQSAQGRSERPFMEQFPKPAGAFICQGVFDSDRAPQPHYILGRIRALYALPTLIFVPLRNGFSILIISNHFFITS
jgi:hypothetical protein